jgi:hypothetical protein
MVPLLYLEKGESNSLLGPIEAKVPSSDDLQREETSFVPKREQKLSTPSLTCDTQRRFF